MLRHAVSGQGASRAHMRMASKHSLRRACCRLSYRDTLSSPHLPCPPSQVSSDTQRWSRSLNTDSRSKPKVAGNMTEIDIPTTGSFSFSDLWLRDNCPCETCKHPLTRQRQHNAIDIPLDIAIQDLSSDSHDVYIRWSHDGHQSMYTWDWLRSWQGTFNIDQSSGEDNVRQWSHVDPSRPDKFPCVPFEEIMQSDGGVGEWTKAIYQHGFSLVSDCPPNPSTTQALLERIAFIRHTHYGGFWDFTSSISPTDTAYTNQSLSVHTDTTYLTDPCGLQMFHLLSHDNGIGGESLLVDGFAAAAHLQATDPEAYACLSSQKILSHASGNTQVGELANDALDPAGTPVILDNHHSPSQPPQIPPTPQSRAQDHPSKPTPPLSSPPPPPPRQIRWNNDDRAPQQWPDLASLERWHAAAQTWTQILTMPRFEIKMQLVPGRPIIFDNWRYLHGRTRFSGDRRLCGGYINMDDFLARYRMTNSLALNGHRRSFKLDIPR